MSKKFGKFLLFSAVAGAAAYGAYQYLQNKEQTASPAATDDADDDLDDFNEDLDEEPTADKERSYVSLNLDKAAAIASESFHKAKEVIADSVQQVRDTVKSVTEGQGASETNFTDLTALKKESEAPKTTPAESVTEDFFTPETPEEETSPLQAETTPEVPITSSPEEAASTVNSTAPAETFFEDTPEAASENSVSSETVEEFFDDDTL